MQRTLVDERRWLGERRFLHALSYCMLLPGPEAQQLAIYTGWLLNGWVGGVIAGVLFVLPGMLALLALSWVYVAPGRHRARRGGVPRAWPRRCSRSWSRRWSGSAGGRCGTGRCGDRAGARSWRWRVFSVPFPLVVLAAAGVGWLLGRWRPAVMAPPPAASADDGPAPLIPDDALHRGPRPRPAATSSSWSAASCCGWLPVLVAFLLTDRDSVFVEQGIFFSGTALVTFGGAYAVLAFVAQKAVETYGWLTGGEMVRWPGAGRDDARAADHGAAVRRVPRRLPRPRRAGPARRRR